MASVQPFSFESNGDTCDGELHLPDDGAVDDDPPVVVMAHGFGAECSFRLPAYAERFVDRGLAVALFDYRGFGDSEGLHHLVDPFAHRDDWLAASRTPSSTSDGTGPYMAGSLLRA